MQHTLTTVLLILSTIQITMDCNAQQKSQCTTNVKTVAKKLVIQIILGSTRQKRTSDRIAAAVKDMADTHKGADIEFEIVDLKDYNLPFLNDEISPSSRENITDPLIQKWSDKIKQADAFIIVVPEYNSGYPGVLKNALDSLYKEWNNKPVAFIGYSGGPSGGSSAVSQLRSVANALKMVPVSCSINIPHAWKAFDTKGNLTHKNIKQELHTMIDQIISTRSLSKKT